MENEKKVFLKGVNEGIVTELKEQGFEHIKLKLEEEPLEYEYDWVKRHSVGCAERIISKQYAENPQEYELEAEGKFCGNTIVTRLMTSINSAICGIKGQPLENEILKEDILKDSKIVLRDFVYARTDDNDPKLQLQLNYNYNICVSDHDWIKEDMPNPDDANLKIKSNWRYYLKRNSE